MADQHQPARTIEGVPRKNYLESFNYCRCWCSCTGGEPRYRSCHNVTSMPGSVKARLSAYGPSMQRRTASAACRSVSPAIYGMTMTSTKRQGATSTGRPWGGSRSAKSRSSSSVPNSARSSTERSPVGNAARTAAAVASGMGGRGAGRQLMAHLRA
jgi:hypothetical protein